MVAYLGGLKMNRILGDVNWIESFKTLLADRLQQIADLKDPKAIKIALTRLIREIKA